MMSQEKTLNRTITAIPVAIFGLIAVMCAFGLANDPRRLPTMLLDKPVPKFALPSLEASGTGIGSNDLSGSVTLLNVFASWCPGCRAEHPVLMRLSREQDVAVYGVNWKDNPAEAARLLQRLGNPYRGVGQDTEGRLGIELGVTGVPETFVIDRTGRIRFRHTGPIVEGVWRDVLAPMLAKLESER